MGRLPLEISLFPVGEGATFEKLRVLWREAERLGFQAIWHEDNVFPHPTELYRHRGNPILDCWMALAALAASTSTIRLGSMVTPAPRRHPALLAKAASSLDNISGGRLTIGMGGGDPTTVQHYTQWGLPFPETPAARVQLLREHLQVQRLLYTEDVSNFRGEYFSLVDAVCSPKPVQRPHPPMWVGLNTRTKVMPRVAAELADGVVVEWGDDAVAAQVVPRLLEACDVLGRDPGEITRARHFGIVVTPGEIDPGSVFDEISETSGVYRSAKLREVWETWMGVIVGPPDVILRRLPDRTTALGFDHAILTVLSVGLETGPNDIGGLPGSALAGIRALAEGGLLA